MADSDTAFWRDLETRFRALHDEQLQDRKKAGLHAYWNSNPANDEPWYLGGGPDDIRTNFEWLVEQAALRLGQPGGRNAVFFWLDLLRSESPHYRPINSSHEVKGEETRWERGGIELVCKASADYCIKCETEELKRQRRRRVMKAFVGRRSNQQPEALTQEGVLRGLKARLAQYSKSPAQHASTHPRLGGAGQTENNIDGCQALVEKREGLSPLSRERGPKLQGSQKEVPLADKLRTEITCVKEAKPIQEAVGHPMPTQPRFGTTWNPMRIKKHDLSRYLDEANLTERQYQCASLRWEHGLSVSQMAKELRLHRKTIDQHIESAKAKMRSAGLYEKVKKGLAKFHPEG